MHAARCGVTTWITVGMLAVLGRAVPVQAQVTGTVAGKVTVAPGGDPLQGASVGIVGSPIGAITRADGSYRFSLRPGTYELRVRMLGYAG